MKLVMASGNRGKLAELQALLAPTDIALIPQSALHIPEAVEDGADFEDNALIKARHASRLSGLAAIADDSGLCVDALDGAPGIFSARYAGDHATAADNIAKLLAALESVPASRRTARFQCVVAVVQHAEDPQPEIFCGDWEGMIAPTAVGENGFGYDPIFFVPEFQRTAAQLDAATKNRVSHRAKALARLKARRPWAGWPVG